MACYGRRALTVLVIIIQSSREYGYSAQIIKAPTSQYVEPDDTAVFNCSISCSPRLPVTWYLTLPTNGRTVPVSQYTSLTQVKNIYGIEVSRGTVNDCSQGGYLVEQLFVKAKQQFHLMPVQCSTVCFSDECSCSDSQVQFSKIGILSIDLANDMVISPVSPSATRSLAYDSRSPSAPMCSTYATTTVTVTYEPTPTPKAR